MASPQKENGYTAIANELYDAIIRWHLSSYESSVLIFLIRKTYGWHKKEDWISLSQFVEATGIRESHVSRTLGLLLKQNIVTKKGSPRKPLWGVQKDYERWVRLPKGVRSHHLTKGGKSNMQKGGDTKETITKEISPSFARAHKTMKKNSFNYNESASSDSYEDAIDLDTQEKVTMAKTNKTKVYWDMLEWAQKRRGFKFINIKKQFKAFKIAKDAGINPEELQNRWYEFEKDKFWKEKGFDWMDITHSFEKRR